MRSRVRTFTLIELLVVVSIIAVLASLLLPALSRARATATATTCVNRMRNLTIAVANYRDDNDEWQPVDYVWSNTVPGWTGTYRFPLLMMTYLQLDDIGIYTTSSNNRLMCPANPYKYTSTLGWTGIRVNNYAPYASIAVNYWNATLYGYGLRWEQENMPKRTESQAPSTTIFSGEGHGNGCSLGYVSGGISSLLYYHPGYSTNVLIEDGHVESFNQGGYKGTGLHFFKE